MHASILPIIGETPMVELSRFSEASGAQGRIFGKLERQNPGGSIKDRAALYMIRDAQERGLLKPGGTIVEPTSGNTGIGLACVAAVLGYRLILTMPQSMSVERRKLLAAYGAQLVLTPASEGMQGAVAKAEDIAREMNAFMPMQFSNPANARAHNEGTAREILQDMDEALDALVACVGTGGTITGLSSALKKALPSLCVVAVEPEESPLLSGGKAGPHGIQGIGANFIPGLYDASLVDKVLTVSTRRAYEAARLLPRTEGLLCGISSGAALAAAVELSKTMLGARIAVILPDTGERYLSTELFEE